MHKTGYVSFGWQTTESEFGPHSRVKEEGERQREMTSALRDPVVHRREVTLTLDIIVHSSGDEWTGCITLSQCPGAY